MRTKVTLVLVFLNVVLFFFIFGFEREWQTDRNLMEARKRVLGPEASNIETLERVSPSPTSPRTANRSPTTASKTPRSP